MVKRNTFLIVINWERRLDCSDVVQCSKLPVQEDKQGICLAPVSQESQKPPLIVWHLHILICPCRWTGKVLQVTACPRAGAPFQISMWYPYANDLFLFLFCISLAVKLCMAMLLGHLCKEYFTCNQEISVGRARVVKTKCVHHPNVPIFAFHPSREWG